MDTRLKEEVHRRRGERCPTLVLMNVRERTRRRWLGLPRLAFPALVIVCIGVTAVVFREGNVPQPHQRIASAKRQEPHEVMETAHATSVSLALFGQGLLDAGEKGGRVILEKTGASVKRGLAALNETLNRQKN